MRPDGSKEDADMPSSSPEGAPVYQATVTEVPTSLSSRLSEWRTTRTGSCLLIGNFFIASVN